MDLKSIKLNDNFKFITWNYDLQLEETFNLFLNNNHEKDEKNNIHLVELDASDIERSPVVKKILKL